MSCEPAIIGALGALQQPQNSEDRAIGYGAGGGGGE